MTSVYVFGPIFLFGQDYLPIYKRIAKLCSKYYDKVIGTYPDFWDSKETPKQFYTRTIDTITKCDLFIAEVSSPSHGVGMELQMGYENDIPLILIAKDTVDLSKSTMVLGIPNLHKIIQYTDLNDLVKKLETELKALKMDN
ncbi:MAG: hypothetical protein V1776_03180 [Candidatus Diapherotrites archaeon]